MNHRAAVVTFGLCLGNGHEPALVGEQTPQEELLQSQLGFQRVNNSLRLRSELVPGRVWMWMNLW